MPVSRPAFCRGPETRLEVGMVGRAAGPRPLRPAAVGIVCLVVHHQLVVHKVETVGLRLVRVQNHLAH